MDMEEDNCWLSYFPRFFLGYNVFMLPRGTAFLLIHFLLLLLSPFCDSLTYPLWGAQQKMFADTLMWTCYSFPTIFLPNMKRMSIRWVLADIFEGSHRPSIVVMTPSSDGKNTDFFLFIQDTQFWNEWMKRTITLPVPEEEFIKRLTKDLYCISKTKRMMGKSSSNYVQFHSLPNQLYHT